MSSKVLIVICLSVLVLIIAYYIRLPDDLQRYRHGSFAPVRKNNQAVWYVDGKDYMSAVADAILAAEKEIMITDWQMNPEIFMKRPDTGVDSLDWRLDKILLRKADQGVRVYILLYWEIKKVLDLGSEHVVKLLDKHKNIEVHRHPDTLTGARNLFLWSHHEKVVIVDRNIAFVGGIDLCYGRWDTRNHELMDNYPTHPAVDESNVSNTTTHARWIGKDYRNTFYNKEDQIQWEKPLEGYNGVERNEIPRMPWHDVSCAFTGEAVQDAVQHFTDRYNAVTRLAWWQTYWNSFLQYFININVVKQLFPGREYKTEDIVLNSGGHNVIIQVLRSVDNWSAGQQHKTSIYNAYIDAIKDAQHFIYIENQFFISSQEGLWRKVQNKIQEALVTRIVRAHEMNENFHVMFFIPVKPEFPGDWDANDMNGDALRATAYWNLATIYHGEDSLFSKLEKKGISKKTAMNYFSVFSLRTYDLIGEHYVTEIVYVHSKIMIVDDRKAIIGSANINDRSMLGDRDSEVAVMIEDLDFVDGQMNGVEYKMGKFAHSLRCDLLKEHLGLVKNHGDEFDININDPLANSFIAGVHSRAELNTVGFLVAFGPGLFPNETVEDFEALKRYKDIPLPRKNTDKLREILEQIKGNIVTYPSVFLMKEVLKPPSFYYGNMYVNREPQQSDTFYA